MTSVGRLGYAFLVAATVMISIFHGSARADLGEETAALLTKLYHDDRRDCGGPSKPAFLCSGVFLRAIWPSMDFDFFDPSPKSKKSGGVSASYLRKDAKFDKLAFGLTSGFFFNTAHGNPHSDEDYHVLCAFPLDGATDIRPKAGCERRCHKEGVSGKEWRSRFGFGHYLSICSFDLSDDENHEAGTAFYEAIQAINSIREMAIHMQNEVRIATWQPAPPSAPSILGFFHTVDTKKAVNDAQLYQIQWYQASKQYLPIINLALPLTWAQDAKFTYKIQPQVIQPTTEPNTCEKYIESAQWISYLDPGFKKRIWTLAIKPTTCGRQVQENQTNNFFNEIASNYYMHPNWKDNLDNPKGNIPSMRRQLICHLANARDRATWDLEPSRPYTSAQNSFNKECNNI